MEALNNRRARLRHELQVAYDAWMVAIEQLSCESDPAGAIDTSGSPETAKVQWFGYLTAKRRLVLAYAELPLAG